MKKISTLLAIVCLLAVQAVSAQTINRGFAFQGYARNLDGSAVSDQNVQVRFTISPNGGAAAFEELQNVQTDVFGIFVADIGTENETDFNALQFENFDYFLKVEVALTGGNFVEISNKQLKSVPYAQSAVTASMATTATKADNGVPSGTILPFAGPATNIPDGYVVCDGTGYDGSNDTYKALFDAIGTSWGEDGTKFRVPDLRGYFLRGISGDTDVDPDKLNRFAINTGGNTGNSVGSYQNDALKIHNHTITDPGHSHSIDLDDDSGGGGIDDADNSDDGSDQTGSSTTGITIDNAGTASESRSKNAYVLYIIKL